MIRELNEADRGAQAFEESARLTQWPEALLERRGSDLLLVTGAPASVRVDGRVFPLPEEPLSEEEIEEVVLPAIPARARALYSRDRIADSSFRISRLGRFRINLHHE